jgi:hypothetical protein
MRLMTWRAHCIRRHLIQATKVQTALADVASTIHQSLPTGVDPDVVAISERLANVRHKILVLSGRRLMDGARLVIQYIVHPRSLS